MNTDRGVKFKSFPSRGQDKKRTVSKTAFGVLSTLPISNGVIANVIIPVASEFSGKLIKVVSLSVMLKTRATKKVSYGVILTNEYKSHQAGDNPMIPAVLDSSACIGGLMAHELLHFWGDGEWGVTGLWDSAPATQGYLWGDGTWGVTGLWDTQTSGAHLGLHCTGKRGRCYLRISETNPVIAIILSVYGESVQHNNTLIENTVEIHYELT